MVARNSARPHWPVLIVASWLSAASVQAAQPLFDAHLHYNAEDAAHYAPEAIVAQLQANRILAATVTSRPPEQVLQLHAQAPRLILPMLGVYRTPADKATWMDDVGLPERVEQTLAEGPWRGVGELHLFAEDRRSPVFLRIVELATSRGLPLQLHCDPAVIDTLFEQVPEATVIWAHAGAYPYPPLLRDYLRALSRSVHRPLGPRPARRAGRPARSRVGVASAWSIRSASWLASTPTRRNDGTPLRRSSAKSATGSISCLERCQAR